MSVPKKEGSRRDSVEDFSEWDAGESAQRKDLQQCLLQKKNVGKHLSVMVP